MPPCFGVAWPKNVTFQNYFKSEKFITDFYESSYFRNTVKQLKNTKTLIRKLSMDINSMFTVTCCRHLALASCAKSATSTLLNNIKVACQWHFHIANTNQQTSPDWDHNLSSEVSKLILPLLCGHRLVIRSAPGRWSLLSRVWWDEGTRWGQDNLRQSSNIVARLAPDRCSISETSFPFFSMF